MKFIFSISFISICSTLLFGQINESQLHKTHINSISRHHLDHYSDLLSSHGFVKDKLNNGLQRFEGSSPLFDSLIIDYAEGQTWIENQVKFVYEYDSDQNLIFGTNYNKDADTNSWVYNFSNTYEYNNAGQLISFLRKTWDLEELLWINSYKIESEYDANGNEVLNSKYYWDEAKNSWLGDYRYQYAFDEFGNRTLYATYRWSSDLNEWYGEIKGIRNFDEQSRLESTSDYQWDSNTKDWLAYSKIEYSFNGLEGEGLGYEWDDNVADWSLEYKYVTKYNNDFRIISESEYYLFYQTNTWKPLSKYEYSYDNQGNITQYMSYGVDIDGNWKNGYKSETIYYGEDIDYYESYYWDEEQSQWYGDFKYERARNTDGNQILFTSYSWDTTNASWMATSKNDSEYSDLGYIVSYYKWANNQWDYSTRYRYYYYNDKVTAIEDFDINVKGDRVKLFPNPANSILSITSEAQILDLIIFNFSGAIVLHDNTITSAHSVRIDHLNSGIYLVIVKTRSGIYKQKLIKN